MATMTTTKQPSGATSLLEKYATLNNAITSTRSEIAQTQNDISSTTVEISSFRLKNRSIGSETNKQCRSVTIFKEEHDFILKEYQLWKQKELESLQSLNVDKATLRMLKNQKEEVRKDFLHSCGEFRRSVRRNRISLEGLRTAAANIGGFGNAGNDRNDNGDTNNDSRTSGPGNDKDSNSGDRFHYTDADADALYSLTEHRLDSQRRINNSSYQSQRMNSILGEESHDNYNDNVEYEYDDEYDDDDDDKKDDRRSEINSRLIEDDEDGMTLSTAASTLSTSIIWDINVENSAMMQMTSSPLLSPSSSSSLVRDDTVKDITAAAGTSTSLRSMIPSPSKRKNKKEKYVRSKDDKEMNQAIQSKINSTKALSWTAQNLDKIREQRQLLVGRARDRSKQLEQQREQLEKVRLDVQEMERKIALLEENTVECRQISDGYIQDAERRKKRMKSTTYNKTPHRNSTNSTVTPSPYTSSASHSLDNSKRQERQNAKCNDTSNFSTRARKNAFINTSTTSSGSVRSAPQQVHNPYKRRSTEDTKNTNRRGQYYRSSLAKQHPHRAGRIRVDKQFTTALSLSSNHDEEEDEEEEDEESSPGSDENSRDKEELSSEKRRFTMSSNVSIDGSLSTTKEGEKSLGGSASSDDEEDDEELLLFIPFEK